MKIGCRSFAVVIMMFVWTNTYGQYVFPLHISRNTRYLVDRHEKPFPILGRTAWFIISQSEIGYREFISNSILHGCNSIEMSVITHWPTGNHAPFNGRGDMPFLKRLNGGPWNGQLTYHNLYQEAPDLLTPNEKYWEYVDDFLSYCESMGILVFLFPGYLGYNGQEQGWMQELLANGAKRTEAYGAWIARRFRNRANIVWMILGDMGKFTAEQKNAEAALVKGLKSVQGESVQFSAESYSGQNSADNVEFGDQMTLNGSYTWDKRITVPYIARKAYNHDPVMPSFLLEEPYDEEGPDGNNYNPNASQPVRRFLWWGWLSTIGGYIAGNGYVWQFADPVWQQHLNTQGALDMSRLNHFIQSISWWKLVPGGSDGMIKLIADENNADTSVAYVSAAASRDGDQLVAYVPPEHSGCITVNVGVLKDRWFAYWFDPTTGRYIGINAMPGDSRGLHLFRPPGKNSAGDNDWVLVLTTKQNKESVQ